MSNTKSWSLNDLMPICLVPHCPKYKTRHLLPHQEKIAKQILSTSANYIYWQGGVGSAKTMLYAALSAAYLIMIPESKAILFRKDLGLNYATLWGYFKASIKAAFEQNIIQGSFDHCLSRKTQGDYSFITLPNGSEARAGQTKNWSEFMGPTYDLIVVSDAMENNNFGEIFHGSGVVGGLQSRLRGQVSTFFTLPNGEIKDFRRFLIESNPPPNINELHRIFGREPGERTFSNSDIKYLHIQSSTIQNDHNPSTYIQEISSQHSSKSDIQRILEGKTIPFYGGIRVYESFYPEIHVNSFEYNSELPLLIGIDTGIQHPAACIAQIRQCDYGQDHFITLSEIANLYDTTIWEFMLSNQRDLLGLLPHLGLFYPQHFDFTHYSQIRNSMNPEHFDSETLSQHFSKILFSIDKSGNKRQASNKDKLSDRQILYLDFGIQTRALNNIGLEKSLERVRNHLSKICLCKVPVLLFSQNCELLIDAYSGGYRFNKRKDGSHDVDPASDHVYEDISDAHRYVLENFFFNKTLPSKKKSNPYILQTHPWEWMEKGIN